MLGKVCSAMISAFQDYEQVIAACHCLSARPGDHTTISMQPRPGHEHGGRLPSAMPPSQAQPQQPYYWPPDSITASYMKFHLDRSKELHGRMCKLHQKANARHPRKPAKKKHKHGHPEDYLNADSSFFSPSSRQLLIALQKHRPGLPLPAFNAVGVVYAIFFIVTGSQQISGHYVGISHRSVAERFEEHIRQAKDCRAGLRILDGEASKLYSIMAAQGIAS